MWEAPRRRRGMIWGCVMNARSATGSRRTGGVAGIVFSVGMLILGFGFYFDQPLYTDSVGTIRQHFVDNADTLPVADWFGAVLFVGAFLLFATVLRTVLGAADTDETWPRLSFAGSVISVAVAGSGVFLATFALGDLADLSDSTIVAMVRADALLYTVILPFGFALFVGAASLSVLRAASFPKWVGWFGLVSALALVIGSLWPVQDDPEGFLAILGMIGFIAAMIWVLVVGIIMTGVGRPAEQSGHE